MGYIVNGNTLIVPEGTVIVGVKDISEYLSKYTIEEISLPTSLEVIEPGTFFDYPEIKKINIPENVREIGSQAFFGLDNLEELIIPDTVFHIGEHAFCNCRRLKLIIAGSMQTVPENWDEEFAGNIGEVCFDAK